jgi:hypothetical protein
MCRGDAANGEACVLDSDCDSQHCIAGSCCESACDAPCMACNGSGLCAGAPSGTACGEATCGVFNTIDEGACDGLGACVLAPVVSCAPGVCVLATCRLACDSDHDCASGSWCDSELGECSDANRPPVAVLTSIEKSLSNLPIPLDGRDSTDPDGDPLTYEITQVLGPPAEIAEVVDGVAVATMPTVKKRKLVVFQLIVSDGELSSEPAFHSIEVVKPPIDGCLAGCAGQPGEAIVGVLGLALMARMRARRRRRRSA